MKEITFISETVVLSISDEDGLSTKFTLEVYGILNALDKESEQKPDTLNDVIRLVSKLIRKLSPVDSYSGDITISLSKEKTANLTIKKGDACSINLHRQVDLS